jgi:hypothetical protein
MIPFGAAALLRLSDRTTTGLIAVALVAGVVALVVLPVLWLGVLAVVLAVRSSAPAMTAGLGHGPSEAGV